MNLKTLRQEIEGLKELVHGRPLGCSCCYVEIVDGELLTEAKKQILEANRSCYDRNPHRAAHVGFMSITVPANRFPEKSIS